MDQLITKLAKSLKVSTHDIKCFAQSVVNSIETDNIADIYIHSSEEDRVKIAHAYTLEANKKIMKFIEMYKINPAAKQAFIESVYDVLK